MQKYCIYTAQKFKFSVNVTKFHCPSDLLNVMKESVIENFIFVQLRRLGMTEFNKNIYVEHISHLFVVLLLLALNK